jgi:N-acetylmuramoyl-L-alanine amidase
MKKLLCLMLVAMSSMANATSNDVIGPKLHQLLEADINCLALNIYHEARSERTAGMWAVADVTINRVRSSQFPNTVCEVVKQGPVYESWKTRPFDLPQEERIFYPVKGRCHFSWWCDGIKDEPLELDSWIRAQSVARNVMLHDVGLGLTDGADHYHADSIEPFWAPHMTHITTIGNHIFYKSNR